MDSSRVLHSAPEDNLVSHQAVTTRRVHYIAGFDPRGARYYHHLYKEEAGKQSRLLGCRLKVGPRRRSTPQVSAWTIDGDWKGQSVATEYEFMAWDDIVRQNWESNRLKLFYQALYSYISYARDGCFGRILKVAKGPFYTALYPMFYIGCLIALVLIMGLIGGSFLSAWGESAPLGEGMAWSIALGLGYLGVRVGESWGVFWLLRDYCFVFAWGSQRMPGVEKRIKEMAGHIRTMQEKHPVDEVLIIGHSLGSIWAVAVTAEILRHAPQGGLPPGMNLLTLGHCIPMQSFMPRAAAIRRDLDLLAKDDRIPWSDGTSAPDGMAFYLVDPVRASGLTPRFPDRPRLFSLRVFKMYPKAAYAKLRRNRLRLHFQYVMASELLAEYDYFQITAGPKAFGSNSMGRSPGA